MPARATSASVVSCAQLRMTADLPETMLPLPGRTQEYSTPISTESRKAVSSIWTESSASARKSRLSIWSLASPSLPGSPERSMPMWQWGSTKAGVTTGYSPAGSPLGARDTPAMVVPSNSRYASLSTDVPV